MKARVITLSATIFVVAAVLAPVAQAGGYHP
jgi:hypothetical protein